MLTASTRLCAHLHTSTQQHALWQRVRVVLSRRGWGGWWGRGFALWKVPTDSIALSEMLSLMLRESVAREWGLRQRDALALAYLFPARFHSLVFLFSRRLSLSKPSVPLFARGLWVGECGQGWVSENVLVDLSQASRGLGESGFFVLCWWKAALDPIYLSLTSGHFTSSQFTVIILNPGPNYSSLPN